MARKLNIEKYNNILNDFNQSIKIISYEKNKVVLNNGLILYDQGEIRRFMKRISNKSVEFIKKYDQIYSKNVEDRKFYESVARSNVASKGGISCQRKHREKIKNNLNTGIPWNKGLTGIFGHPHTDESKQKISRANSGEKNGMYGVKHSEEYKKNHSDIMKQKILDGSFTPNIKNSRTHWQVNFRGKKYRSSWEAVFQYLNPLAEYEKIRIPYVDYDGKERIYIVDFAHGKQLYEIKPLTQKNNLNIKCKEKYALEWCRKNGYEYIIIDEKYFLDRKHIIDFNLFDNKTKEKLKWLN